MNKILISGLCILALAACEKKELPLATAKLKCSSHEVVVKVFDGRIDATIDGDMLSMPQVVAASGAKYQFENLILWNKGEDWMMRLIEDENEIHMDCINIKGGEGAAAL